MYKKIGMINHLREAKIVKAEKRGSELFALLKDKHDKDPLKVRVSHFKGPLPSANALISIKKAYLYTDPSSKESFVGIDAKDIVIKEASSKTMKSVLSDLKRLKTSLNKDLEKLEAAIDNPDKTREILNLITKHGDSLKYHSSLALKDLKNAK